MAVELPKEMFSDFKKYDFLCPWCENNLLDRIKVNPDGTWNWAICYDDESVYVHPDRDEYDSPARTRGGYVRIDHFCLNCEVGISFFVANAKGMEYLHAARLNLKEFVFEEK